MPRGKKKVLPEPVVEVKKVKKPYPTLDERIALAEESIGHWERLNQERRDLIAKSEKQLQDRRETLAKGEAELERLMERKDQLIARRDGGEVKVSGQRKVYAEIVAALKASGRTMDDLLAELKGAAV